MSEQEANRRTRIGFGAAIVAGQLAILLRAFDGPAAVRALLPDRAGDRRGRRRRCRPSAPAGPPSCGWRFRLRRRHRPPAAGGRGPDEELAPLVILPGRVARAVREPAPAADRSGHDVRGAGAAVGADRQRQLFRRARRAARCWCFAVAAMAAGVTSGCWGRCASRDRLSGVLAAATGNAIVATDREGTITVFNPGAEARRLSARRRSSARPRRRCSSPMTSSRMSRRSRWRSPRAEGRGDARADLRPQGRDAPPLSQTLTTERGLDGRVVGYLGVATDVTQQVRAQSALVAERDFTSAVLDTAGSLVIVTDRQALPASTSAWPAAPSPPRWSSRSIIDTLMPPSR